LSAPALKRSLIAETESIPPPTVNGIFTDLAVLETRSTKVFLLSTLALISKNTNSSAPSSEYLQANSTGSPESLKLTKFTPLTYKEDIMELEAAKMIGAGLAAIALAGAGVGIGIIFGNYLSGAMRNPSAAQKQFPNLLLGFALAEATGLFGLVVALIILFAF